MKGSVQAWSQTYAKPSMRRKTNGPGYFIAEENEMNKTTLALSEITSDPAIQSRAVLSEETVTEYAEHYRDGVEMPPVTVFFDGSTH